MLDFTTDQWVIVMLVFVLGLLVGGFLFSGGGRKWKHRYNAEVDRRRELETTHSAREKEWREQDALRAAALRDAERNRTVAAAPVVATGDPRDVNNDGVVTPAEKPVGFVDRILGRDRDGDGVKDSADRDPDDSTRA
ncbi:hypothetical protein [Sphingomonas jaspsi]|uniref:hypothetical protein n=1 Tax=Sphingomonas jaspsi TaxID=392409 RepID=UPI0004B6C11E|nr:hypothetical protein [Sphingomonas jaspsi]